MYDIKYANSKQHWYGDQSIFYVENGNKFQASLMTYMSSADDNNCVVYL
jgi:hypothetical protein